MSKSVQDLQDKFEKAEAQAHKIQADRDEALEKLRDRFDDRLRKANADAAEAQKAWLDAQVREELRDRPDGETLAGSLGIDLNAD